jgi:hypothetical protein
MDPAQSMAKPICIKLQIGYEMNKNMSISIEFKHKAHRNVQSVQDQGSGKDQKESIQTGG